MNNGEQKPGRRTRLNEAANQHLERLRANKAQMDLKKREREQREDSALARFAEACSRAERLLHERDQKLAELANQADELRASCQAQVEQSQTDQVAALNELRAAGRTAEEIAALLELPRERVRRLLRTPRQSRRRTSTNTNGSPAEPPAIPIARLADLSDTATGGVVTSGSGS